MTRDRSRHRSSGRRRPPLSASRGAAAVLVLALAATGPAAAQEAPAKVEVGKSRIEWHPGVEYETATLVVSGPGVEWERRFKAGERPAVDLERERGFADGLYSWELRLAPRLEPGVREKLAALRREGREPSAQERERLGLLRAAAQSGSFSVLGGALVPPGVTERGADPEPPEKRGQLVEGSLRVTGDLVVEGAKSFAVSDPADPGRTIYFAALEGPEAGTYLRGSARTQAGEAVIELPEVFAKVTEPHGLTVQLTPVGGWSRLYVAERGARRLVVRDADGGEVEFDYLLQGVRAGYAGYRVERAAGDGR